MKYINIELSRDLDSMSQFNYFGFDHYGAPFYSMNATLHYPAIGDGVCLVSYNTPAAFIVNDHGTSYIYYIKSSPTTERQITRFLSNYGLDLPAAKRKKPNEWIKIDQHYTCRQYYIAGR